MIGSLPGRLGLQGLGDRGEHPVDKGHVLPAGKFLGDFHSLADGNISVHILHKQDLIHGHPEHRQGNPGDPGEGPVFQMLLNFPIQNVPAGVHSTKQSDDLVVYRDCLALLGGFQDGFYGIIVEQALKGEHYGRLPHLMPRHVRLPFRSESRAQDLGSSAPERLQPFFKRLTKNERFHRGRTPGASVLFPAGAGAAFSPPGRGCPERRC